MSLPEYLKDKSASKQGREQEKKAKQHINSGAIWFQQGDLSTDKYLVDVKKAITQKQVTLSEVKIKKLFDVAVDANKTLVYLIYLGDYVIKAIVERNPNKRIT